MELKGSKTEQHLLISFAGESQARNRYTYFASQARKDGYRQIESVFNEIANQEKEHAKIFFKYLKGGDVEITYEYPAGVIGTTADNLKAAANGERHEHSNMYPEFAKIADEEGFPEIAETFRQVSIAEQNHERRFLNFLKEIEAGTVFKKSELVTWTCSNCGWTHKGTQAPDECLSCKHPLEHFHVLCEYA